MKRAFDRHVKGQCFGHSTVANGHEICTYYASRETMGTYIAFTIGLFTDFHPQVQKLQLAPIQRRPSEEIFSVEEPLKSNYFLYRNVIVPMLVIGMQNLHMMF
ncbi:hypothetical protein DdX_09413 [Ditylenchus destructor]|uniref:Uncharacterized protein n=1 Tax=Ditylenchus destructor TaxID=166010 RepID=A0AAD4N107_9BILA|nr:hypothetical protein DdX_09413 [Ditylenchus destructor]